MIIFGGDSSDGVLDLGEGTEPVEITRCMQYRLIKGGPRELRPNGHNIYTRHLEMPKRDDMGPFSRWAEIADPIQETRLRTQITFLRQNFRRDDSIHTLCDAADVLLGKGLDEPALHETIAAQRRAWHANDGAEGDTVRAVCDALERLLMHRHER